MDVPRTQVEAAEPALRTSVLALLALLVLVPAARPTAAPSPVGSGVLHYADERREAHGPLWVPAAALLDDAGEPRWDAIDARLAEQLRRAASSFLEHGPGSCSTTIACGLAPARPYFSLQDLVDHASAAYRGRVVAVEDGFTGGSSPSRLLDVSVQRILWAHDGMPRTEVIRVLYPRGEFDFAGIPLCHYAAGFDRLAEVGDDLLLFAYEPPVDRASTVLVPEPEQIVFAIPAGGAEPLTRLTDGDEVRDAGSLDGVEDLVRRKLAGDPAARPFDEEACRPRSMAWREVGLGRLADLDRCRIRRGTPATSLLVLDPGGTAGISVSGYRHAVDFDLDADGRPETLGWPWTAHALLWIDRDGDGRPTNGTEVLTAQTPLPDGGVAGSAFAALAAWDSPAHGGNGDGSLDAGDRVWAHLGLWGDQDRDGVATAAELFGPDDLCLRSLSLDAAPGRGRDGAMTDWLSRSRAVRRDAMGRARFGVLHEVSPVFVLPDARPAVARAAPR